MLKKIKRPKSTDEAENDNQLIDPKNNEEEHEMPVMKIVTFDENVYIIGEKEADVLNDLEEDVRQFELFNRRHESFMQELSNP